MLDTLMFGSHIRDFTTPSKRVHNDDAAEDETEVDSEMKKAPEIVNPKALLKLKRFRFYRVPAAENIHRNPYFVCSECGTP